MSACPIYTVFDEPRKLDTIKEIMKTKFIFVSSECLYESKNLHTYTHTSVYMKLCIMTIQVCEPSKLK